MDDLITLDYMEAGKKAKLVNITQYAAHWGTTRDVIYEKIKKGVITVYDVEGKPYLNIDENPQVRPYTKE